MAAQRARFDAEMQAFGQAMRLLSRFVRPADAPALRPDALIPGSTDMVIAMLTRLKRVMDQWTRDMSDGLPPGVFKALLALPTDLDRLVFLLEHATAGAQEASKCKEKMAHHIQAALVYSIKVKEVEEQLVEARAANESLLIEMEAMRTTGKGKNKETGTGGQSALDRRLSMLEKELREQKIKSDADKTTMHGLLQQHQSKIGKLEALNTATEADVKHYKSRTNLVEKEMAALRLAHNALSDEHNALSDEHNVLNDEHNVLMDDRAVLYVGEILKIYQLTLCAWVLGLPLVQVLRDPKAALPRGVRHLAQLEAYVYVVGLPNVADGIRQRWRALVAYLGQQGLTTETVAQQLRNYAHSHRTPLAHPDIVGMLKDTRRADVEANFDRVFHRVRNTPLVEVLRFVQSHVRTRWDALARAQPGDIVPVLPPTGPETPEAMHAVFAHYVITGVM